MQPKPKAKRTVFMARKPMEGEEVEQAPIRPTALKHTVEKVGDITEEYVKRTKDGNIVKHSILGSVEEYEHMESVVSLAFTLFFIWISI